MLKSLDLIDYRGFHHYRLAGLSRVNLLVGRNNCGKTSVLEGAYLLATGGDPTVVSEIAWQRGEIILASDSRDRYRGEAYPLISHFFHGHEFGPKSRFSIRSEGAGEITLRIATLPELEKQAGRQALLFDELGQEGLGPTLAVLVEASAEGAAAAFPPLPVTEEGAVAHSRQSRYGRALRGESRVGFPVQFISPDSLQPRSMSEMWNRVLTDGRESEVIDALRILEPTLQNVFFLSGETAFRYAGRAGVLAAFSGSRRRDPLGSHGDGMRRLLALSLALIQSQGGILLIDEVDTGLHYSVMGDMWHLVVRAAIDSDVQVFATTHSLDCVKGLAWLCDNHPQLQSSVSLQKIDLTLGEAVGLDAEQIVMAVSQGMEVR